MKRNDQPIFVKCKCGCNVMEILHDDEFEEFNISMWISHAGSHPLSKKERIRWCEHVMKTGKPWADYTVVTHKDAQRIVTYLTKNLNKPKHGKTKN